MDETGHFKPGQIIDDAGPVPDSAWGEAAPVVPQPAPQPRPQARLLVGGIGSLGALQMAMAAGAAATIAVATPSSLCLSPPVERPRQRPGHGVLIDHEPKLIHKTIPMATMMRHRSFRRWMDEQGEAGRFDGKSRAEIEAIASEHWGR